MDVKETEKVSAVFGRNVRAARRGQGWSQEDLADKAGLTLKYVSDVELGKRRVSLEVAVRIARVLNTPVDSLCGEDASRSSKPLPYRRPVHRQIMNLAEGLSPNFQKRALTILRAAFQGRGVRWREGETR